MAFYTIRAVKVPRTTAKLHQPFDASVAHMGTAIKHPVPDRVKPSFVIVDIRDL